MTREELRAELDKFQEKALLKSSLAWDTFDTLKESVLARVQKLSEEKDEIHRLYNFIVEDSKKSALKIRELEGWFAEIRKLAEKHPTKESVTKDFKSDLECYFELDQNWFKELLRLLPKKEGLVGET